MIGSCTFKFSRIPCSIQSTIKTPELLRVLVHFSSCTRTTAPFSTGCQKTGLGWRPNDVSEKLFGSYINCAHVRLCPDNKRSLEEVFPIMIEEVHLLQFFRVRGSFRKDCTNISLFILIYGGLVVGWLKCRTLEATRGV